MLGFVWFINLIVFLLTLSCSSFLWEYWYLLIPGICNLGHGNHHWVAISKTFTKRLLWIFKICFGRFFFRSYCFSTYIFLILFCPNWYYKLSCSFYIFKLWGRSISSEAFLKSFRNTWIESECKQTWPWTSLYMDGTAIFDLPTWGGPLIILKVRAWTFLHYQWPWSKLSKFRILP